MHLHIKRLLLCLLATFLCLACQGKDFATIEPVDGDLDSAETDEETDPEAAFRFPDGFLFGTATAGFQVDMGCPTLPAATCVDDKSDWYAYMTSDEMLALEKTHLNGDDPAVAGPGHWELYESDYDLAASELHNNSFRMSIEWSRLFPTATDNAETHEELLAIANPDAIATYHAMFAAMRARGLEPLVTLHHYTIPVWMHDAVGCTLDIDTCTEKGWLDSELMVREITKYARFCAEEFGGDVDLWATQNEPFAVIVSGFLMPTEERTNPPALNLDAEAAKTALTAMIDAHARMTDAVHEADTEDASGDGVSAMVGLVYAMAPVLPADPNNPDDVETAANIFYLWNLMFLDGAVLGHQDTNLDGIKTFREDWVGRMDFIGLNYKQSIILEGLGISVLPALSPLLTLNPATLDITKVHPRGLYEMLKLLVDRYGVPVIITENDGQGMWRGDIAFEKRTITENMQWMLVALEEGIDLRGYFYWSFMDNIEWNHGTDPHLGFYSVDPNDPQKTRTPKDTVPLFARICEANAIEPDLRESYPINRDEAPTGGVLPADVFMEMEE